MGGRWTVGLMVVVVVCSGWFPVEAAGGADGPVVVVDPDSGPCGRWITMRGSGFPPGYSVGIESAYNSGGDHFLGGGTVENFTVPADGRWEVSHLPCSSATLRLREDPSGTPILIRVSYRPDPMSGADTSIPVPFRIEGKTLPGLPNTGGGGAVGRGAVHVGALATPVVTLSPAQGPCVGPLVLTLRGSGLPAGIVPGYSFGIRGQSLLGWGNLPVVASDGTLTARIELPSCEVIPVLPGAVIVVEVWDRSPRDSARVSLGSATYTVTDPQHPGLPNTGGGGAAKPHSAILVAALGGSLLVGGALLFGRRRRGV
jgi:hypothetical protein